ncbi:MAG: ATP-dependent DNA helicase, partial [Anderseniella sp.]|nr:ATP-dependent DNA helicase [Anderseniella sp.]
MVLDGVSALRITAGGQPETIKPAAALKELGKRAHVVCHAGYLVNRLALAAQVPQGVVRTAREQAHLDVCELFAFVAPAVMAVPTPRGLSAALGLETGLPDADLILTLSQTLLDRVAQKNYPNSRETFQVAQFLDRGKWPWAKLVIQRLGRDPSGDAASVFATGLNVWDRIDEWEDDGPRPPGAHEPVTAAEAQTFLAGVLGGSSEARPQQVDYAGAATAAFVARETPASNAIVLAEAGTGLGKTLGYLAPSYL